MEVGEERPIRSLDDVGDADGFIIAWNSGRKGGQRTFSRAYDQ
jgi:hypothetical protein